jgi:hypothetical protein
MLAISSGPTAQAQASHYELANLPFPSNRPSEEASARLHDELQFQRAVQVYLWALPAMSMVAMRDAQAAGSARAATSSPSGRPP